MTEKFPIYILAGGKSSRFGSDKARANFHGEPLILRIARILQPYSESIRAVADIRDKYADLGLPTIADVRPGLGPMGGLIAALNDRPSPGWLLLCSCDMLALDIAWVTTLANARGLHDRAAAFKGERIEPLFALYHTDLIKTVERAIAVGRLSPSRLIEEVSAAILPLPTNWPTLAHINTRDELARATLNLKP